jgi:hypothetical protein
MALASRAELEVAKSAQHSHVPSKGVQRLGDRAYDSALITIELPAAQIWQPFRLREGYDVAP